MVEYTVDIAKEAFASEFVDDALVLKTLGGHKEEDRPVWLYLGLPIAGRPAISWFFDREYYLQRYPDIQKGQIDPLIHFINWGASENRSPHPLIEPNYIRSAAERVLPDQASIADLYRVLSEDLADPSPYFSREYYRSQLPPGIKVQGLLRHFLENGFLQGLRPAPGFEPVTDRDGRTADFDLRSALRRLPQQTAERAIKPREAPDPLPISRAGDTGLHEIHLYCLAWNEAKMLPHFLRHYGGFVDRFFVFDNGSTDDTLSMLAANERVTVSHFDVPGDSFVEEERRLSDTVWQQSRGKARWVIVVDIDEFLHHPNLRRYLDDCARDGVTAIEAIGYEMVTDQFPPAELPLTETVTCGVREPFYDKLCIFDPNAIASPNYRLGRHTAAPSGHVQWPAQRQVKLLHYKRLGVDYVARRYTQLKPGLRPRDHENRWGFQYLMSRDEIEAEFERFRRDAAPVPGLGGSRPVELRLAVDGRVLEPSEVRHNRYTFAPMPSGRVYRLSAATDDSGQKQPVPVAEIFFGSASGVRRIAADHPALLEGWSDIEAIGSTPVCWTTGDAIIPIPPEVGPIAAIEVALRWPLTPPVESGGMAEPAAGTTRAESHASRSHIPVSCDRHRHLITEKLRLEAAMQRQPDDIAVREAYFDCLLRISQTHFGAIFASLPEIRTPMMFRGASSDVLNLTNIFSYAEDPGKYAYGVYGIDMPEPRRILDIGAYCGYSAVYFANRFQDAEIVCIEPPGANFDVLAANTAAYANIRCVPAAIWPRRTHVLAAGHVSGDWGNVYAEAPDLGAPSAIPAYTIDEVLELVGWDSVDLVKCWAETSTVDALCAKDRDWLKQVACVCAGKPAGRWPNPGDDARLQATFPEVLFKTAVYDSGLHVFTRRDIASLPQLGPVPVRLVPPSPQRRPMVLADVPEAEQNFHKFDDFNFQLVPNPPGARPATLKLRVWLHGHTRFRSTVIVEPTPATVRLRFCLIAMETGSTVADAVGEPAAASPVNWEVGFKPASGWHEVQISTEALRASEGGLWARFIDPRFE
jgi:FkbM family methyltransferase